MEQLEILMTCSAGVIQVAGMKDRVLPWARNLPLNSWVAGARP